MAVYTEVSDDEMRDFIAEYDIGDVVSFTGIAEGVENSNFLVHTETGPYILTIYEKRVNPAELPFFIDLMEHLAARGLACPTPLHGRDGQVLRQLCGRPAAMVTFLRGMSAKRLSTGHCGALGSALAEMHAKGADFAATRANNLSVSGWRPLFDQCRSGADAVKPGLEAFIAERLDYLEAHWPRTLPSGLIHADLFPDNVFFRTDKETGEEKVSGLIDFYFACTDALAYDVAICLNAWCFEADGAFNATKARALLNNYRKVRPMTADEMDALPILAQGAAMRFLLTRLYDWINTPSGALVKRKDPLEYYRKLRFHQGVPGPGAYGVA
ncbi:MAG: homoserine kinase [Magnetospirillum gryphiswaldense]|nr:homoserine kinase [Magnetospirillum gryphiswaldense]